MSTKSTVRTVFIYPFKYCENPWCAKLVKPREGEPLSKFLRRGHCNDACARENPLRRKAQSEAFRRRREIVPSRVCVVCNEEFSKRETEHNKRYKLRNTCSRKCAARKRTVEKETFVRANGKTCVNPLCGKTFYRRLKGESEARFAKRETCSAPCGHIKRRKDPHKVQKEVKKTRVKKTPVDEHKLPPVTPLKRNIPEASKPEVVEVWRPASWGGPIKRQVS